MISKRLRKDLPFWKSFNNLSKKQKQLIIKSITLDQTKDLEELFHNILIKNLPVSDSLKSKLKRRKRSVKRLADKKVSLKKKKQVIQSGGGLPLISLAVATLPTLIELLSKYA
jgi:predicted RNase H-like nuclease (RuvC/YqgF family)